MCLVRVLREEDVVQQCLLAMRGIETPLFRLKRKAPTTGSGKDHDDDIDPSLTFRVQTRTEQHVYKTVSLSEGALSAILQPIAKVATLVRRVTAVAAILRNMPTTTTTSNSSSRDREWVMANGRASLVLRSLGIGVGRFVPQLLIFICPSCLSHIKSKLMFINPSIQMHIYITSGIWTCTRPASCRWSAPSSRQGKRK